jgi:cobalamin biosynthesis protein CobD/CbiB
MANGDDVRSPGDLMQDVLRDMSEIVRGEIRLAKAEMSEKARKGANVGALFGAAALGGLLAAMAIVACCIAALAIVLPLWLAALIAGVLLGMAAGMAFLAGRERLKRIDVAPRRTVETMRENLQWAKHRMT